MHVQEPPAESETRKLLSKLAYRKDVVLVTQTASVGKIEKHFDTISTDEEGRSGVEEITVDAVILFDAAGCCVCTATTARIAAIGLG